MKSAGSRVDFEEELKNWLSGATRVVIAGIGNEIRQDDFVGVKIVRDLQDKVPASVHLIECETVPESFMDEIIELKPSHVLLIDAAMLNMEAGVVHLYEPCKIANIPAITTHMLPLRVFCEYVTELSKAKLALLLVQPLNVDFGEGLSKEVAKSSGDIVEVLIKLLS